MLKLLMIGAGGIGGYYAARLLDAGHQVVLTARGEHLDALENNGLTVHHEGRELAHMPDVFDHRQLLRRYKADDFDVIVMTLKATATALVLSELGAWLKHGRTPVLSLQNGVDLEKTDLDEMFELISNFNAIKTSMLVDKEKGRPLELDSIAGAVLRRCELLGVEAPYTATINALLLHSDA